MRMADYPENDDVFDWTMTYRTDSDIVASYGRYYEMNNVPEYLQRLKEVKNDPDLSLPSLGNFQ
jgi:hypothetical protein